MWREFELCSGGKVMVNLHLVIFAYAADWKGETTELALSTRDDDSLRINTPYEEFKTLLPR